jgi:thymidine kinase
MMFVYAYRKLSTHDRQMFKAKPISRLEEIRDMIKEVDVVGIDEGQFFPDVSYYSYCPLASKTLTLLGTINKSLCLFVKK